MTTRSGEETDHIWGGGDGKHISVMETNPSEDVDGSWRNYESAVSNGFYFKDSGGLTGKYDNVRRYWEDQITRFTLREFVEPLVTRKRRDLSRIRVLDLGAGSGEGYEILTNLKKGGDSLATNEVDVLPREILGCYKGLDISPAMVGQGGEIYANDPKVTFAVADLREGLKPVLHDAPYDVYFSSFGSLSHLRDEEIQNLLEEICDHMDGSCVFVADLIGRYSFEWQCYWEASGADESNLRQYSMSYLYPEDLLDKIEVERFPMRYWGGKEFDEFATGILDSKGVRIRHKRLKDRSILVGRHMNTREYNPYAHPLRSAVNSLHEYNQRTMLDSLIFDYTPHPGFDELNTFFERYQASWNAVVYAAIEALEHWSDAEWLKESPPEAYPEVVQDAISTIRNVVRSTRWFRMGDPLANVVEPQLGYVLRNLEMDVEKGLGAAHGLLAIYEIEKD